MEEKPKKNLRTGFTTGACAAAASKAAMLALVQKKGLEKVEITLPKGQRVAFALKQCSFSEDSASCSVIKDAGDDPDCTHGAEIVSTVKWTLKLGIEIIGGSGVGKITKDGLGLAVGSWAINSIPRKMIAQSVQEALESRINGRGVSVSISVPQGEEMAKKTLNARLGIVGGISILGTTGIVRPFSTGAYLMSISQAVEVAKKNGCEHLVITTGGKSEEFARKILPDLPEVAFIQMGDFVGYTLNACVRLKVLKVTICGMMGKLSKIAAGKMQTHASGSEVNMDFLADVALASGAPENLIEEVRKANTGRHVCEIVLKHGFGKFFEALTLRICGVSRAHIKDALPIECILTDFEGGILGRNQIG